MKKIRMLKFNSLTMLLSCFQEMSNRLEAGRYWGQVCHYFWPIFLWYAKIKIRKSKTNFKITSCKVALLLCIFLCGMKSPIWQFVQQWQLTANLHYRRIHSIIVWHSIVSIQLCYNSNWYVIFFRLNKKI